MDIGPISSTQLNSFVASPQSWYFDQVGLDDDNYYTARGTAVHDWAEYYASAPERARDEFEDGLITQRAREFVHQHTTDHQTELFTTEFDCLAPLVMGVVDDLGLKSPGSSSSIPGYQSSRSETIYGPAEHPRMEVSFEENGIRGRVDCLPDSNWIVDFKTGRYRSPAKMMKKASVKTIHEQPDFQPPMYLLHHRRHHDGPIDFSLLFVRDGLHDLLRGDSVDWRDQLSTITYYDQPFDELMVSRDVYDELTSGVSSSHDRRKTLEKMEYDAYRTILQNAPVDSIDFTKSKSDALESAFTDRLLECARNRVGDYKYVKKGIEKTVKALVDFRQENYTREDLDQFEEFLEDVRSDMKECRENNNYPVSGYGDRSADDLHQADQLRHIGGLRPS